jgi:hypothetical protein
MGWHALSTGVLVHIPRLVEDVGHHLIGGHEVVRVEGINDTLLWVAESTRAGDATQHEKAKVVGVDGRRPMYELAGFVVLIESLLEEVDIVSL